MLYSKLHQMLLLLFLLYVFYISTTYKEQFLQECQTNKSCKSCADQSGCSWCPAKKTCMNSTSLKSTDTECNQMNTINSSFACINQPAVNILKNEPLYTDRIQEKPRPPNVFIAPNMEYSHETIMGEMSHLKGELKDFQDALPDIITNTMQNNIQPILMSQF